MNGKYFYFAIIALFAVLSSTYYFLPSFALTIINLFLLTKYKKFTMNQLLLVLAIFLIFCLSGYHAKKNNQTIIPESITSFYVEYNENTKIDGDLLQVTATDIHYKEKLLIRYKMKSEEEKEGLKNSNFYRRVCSVTGQLSKPRMVKNPNAFNYQQYLGTKQIYWILEIQDSPLRKCVQAKGTPLILIKEIRYKGINFLEKNFPPEVASLSAALIFGDRSMFDPKVLLDYQKTGIVHLLAISGLHVSLLVGMIFYLGIRIGMTRQFMVNFLLIILPIYAILTGASPSVIRSVLTIFLVLLVVKLKSRIKLLPIDAISLALCIYLFFSPFIVYDAGFQLSFSVSFVIIISAPYILQHYQQPILAMIVISIISQLAALPILLYHFFELSFVSILANLLYIPLFSFIFLPGLYFLFFLQLCFTDIPALLVQFFLRIISMANKLIEYLGNITFFQLVTGRPDWGMIFIYLLLISVIFLLWEARLQSKGKRFIILLMIILFSFQNVWNLINPNGEVSMIDVGQGDSILIHYPHGRGTYLIDTGGTMQFEEEEWKKPAKPYEVGRDVVVPFLKGKGISKIDKLILTHGDTDHMGGAFAVMEELKVKEILLPSVFEPSESEIEIIRLAEKKGIPVILVSEGSQWKNRNSVYYVLSPEENYQGERNSGSIALFANIGCLNWFFGGDLDQAGEEKIILKYPQLKIDVLKAGHHGSKTSTSPVFVNQLKPRIALISVGERNRYGHPHREVLEELNHTRIFRTDLEGAITYRFYQEKGTFSSFLHMIKQ